MNLLEQRYKDFKFGVVNAIEETDIPIEAVMSSRNCWYKENRWRKIPGLVEKSTTAVGTDPVWGIYRSHQIVPDESFFLIASGGDVYKFNEQTKAFSSIFNGFIPNRQIEFLNYQDRVYFGSQENTWRRYDGGEKTYSIGGANPPKQFARIIYNPYSGRFFAIGDKDNPDYLYWSSHIDDGGIEVWPAGNIQVVETVNGDYPLWVDIFEGRINIFNQNSIHSGDVTGVPEVWRFVREKSQTGTIAGRTVKRQGNSFFMLSPQFELYKWPEDRVVSKGRVKFKVNPHFAHLAWAEIFEDRYYVLCFKNSENEPSDNYDMWIYDILGDRFYGPHKQYNCVSGFLDKVDGALYMGGAEDLDGFCLEFRGLDIKNEISKVSLKSAFSDYGFPEIDKRYHMAILKMAQQGQLPGGEGQLELIINTDNKYNNPQSQRISLADPPSELDHITETSVVRRSITKRAYIHEAYSRGNSIQWELKHEVRSGDFELSELLIQYFARTKKEDRKS